MITRNGALTAPIVALDKHLRDGRHLVLTLVSRGRQELWGFWMQATLSGEVVADRFESPVRRNASPVAGLPHTIDVPIERGFKPVGLTNAEADQLDAATREWRQRPIRLAREAAPDARTWKVRDLPAAAPLGTIMLLGGGPVVVLNHAYRDIEVDGLSYGLSDESGTLVTVTVRGLTNEELQEWRQLREQQANVGAAYSALFPPRGEAAGLFGWPRHGEPMPADAATCERSEVPANGRTVHVMGTPWALTLGDGVLYCQAITGEAYAGTIRHPATPDRLAVFETLYQETGGAGFLHTVV
ncbi:hypothetical protein [Nonomuraea sp. NPDC023979]|uniref:hypothetical protein n=1 Tax=Nonomuraea sp. NPDC023979 TaxID=3154796 RepID=UPI0033CE1BFB